MKSNRTTWTRRLAAFAAALCWVAACTAVAAPDASLSARLQGSSFATRFQALENGADLKALNARMEKVVEAVSPSVVSISAGGSGVVVTADGYVLSVAHVGRRAGRRTTFTFPDGRTASGVTLGNCRDVDAALMKITDPGPWPHVDMGSSGDVKPGQWCMALSYPVTFEHGKGPVVRAGRVLRPDRFAIVTDCAIMGGDSGGPLFDLDGKVIGISSTCNDSLLENRHVAVDRFRDEWKRLANSEDYNGRADQSALLGFRPDPRSISARLGSVVPHSPADEAGFRAGDVILRFDGQPVHVYEDLRPLAAKHHPGCTCDLIVEVRRNGEILTFHTSFATTDKGRVPRSVTRASQRNGSATQAAARELVSRSAMATVRILSDGKPIALGTVVDADGYIVTKASLLAGNLNVRLSSGREVPAVMVGGDHNNDLALLRVKAAGLTAVEWRTGPVPPPGSLVAAPGDTVALGVVSTNPRRIEGSTVPPARQGWLGISLSEEGSSVVIDNVMHNGPADRAGLRDGDVVVAINGQPVKSAARVSETVRNAGPGAHLTVSIRRNSLPLELTVTLRRRPGLPSSSAEDNWGGGPFSDRRWGFPSVLPHDIAIRPQDCGGPLVDADGKVVGINIARALRVSTFALPVAVVQDTVRALMPATAAGE